MTATAFALLLLSACLHVAWNVFSKSVNPSIGFFLRTNLAGTLFITPVLIPFGGLILRMPPFVWVLLATTGLCQAVYFAGLAGAYRHGHLSVAYPLARSLPIVFVAVVAAILATESSLGPYAAAGILAILAGSVLVPMRFFRDLSIRNYVNTSCAFAVVAAVGTAGYTVLDDAALARLAMADHDTVGPVANALVWLLLEAAATTLWLAVFALVWSPKGIPTPPGGNRWRQASMTAAAIFATYFLVLISYGLVTNVSYAIAFRQISVPLGALAGVWLLREPFHVPKLVGVALMFFGLVLIAFD